MENAWLHLAPSANPYLSDELRTQLATTLASSGIPLTETPSLAKFILGPRPDYDKLREKLSEVFEIADSRAQRDAKQDRPSTDPGDAK